MVLITFDYDLTDKHYGLNTAERNQMKSLMLHALVNIQKLGVIVISLAGDKTDESSGINYNYILQGLALRIPLIRVGSVDKTGNITPQSRQGNVYMVGQNFVCAEASLVPLPSKMQNKYIDKGQGTAGGEFALIKAPTKQILQESAHLLPLKFISFLCIG